MQRYSISNFSLSTPWFALQSAGRASSQDGQTTSTSFLHKGAPTQQHPLKDVQASHPILKGHTLNDLGTQSLYSGHEPPLMTTSESGNKD